MDVRHPNPPCWGSDFGGPHPRSRAQKCRPFVPVPGWVPLLATSFFQGRPRLPGAMRGWVAAVAAQSPPLTAPVALCRGPIPTPWLAPKAPRPRSCAKEAQSPRTIGRLAGVEVAPVARSGGRSQQAVKQLTEGTVLRVLYALCALYPHAVWRVGELPPGWALPWCLVFGVLAI